MTPIPAHKLRYLRNQIPITDVIQLRLRLPCSYRDNFWRFLCPICNEGDTAINPLTNLGRCFRCQRNFNPIDIVMAVRHCSFLDAIKFLEQPALANQHSAALSRQR